MFSAALRSPATAWRHNLRMAAGAMLAVTEITPCPPRSINSQAVSSSPLSSRKPSRQPAFSVATRARSPLASLTPMMFSNADSRITVSGSISHAVLLGTLYRICGIGARSAMQAKCRYKPSCVGLL